MEFLWNVNRIWLMKNKTKTPLVSPSRFCFIHRSVQNPGRWRREKRKLLFGAGHIFQGFSTSLIQFEAVFPSTDIHTHTHTSLQPKQLPWFACIFFLSLNKYNPSLLHCHKNKLSPSRYQNLGETLRTNCSRSGSDFTPLATLGLTLWHPSELSTGTCLRQATLVHLHLMSSFKSYRESFSLQWRRMQLDRSSLHGSRRLQQGWSLYSF